jgi:hypothetical protein
MRFIDGGGLPIPRAFFREPRRPSTARPFFCPTGTTSRFAWWRANLKREGLDARLLRDTPERILAAFGVRREHTGESMENLLKIHHTLKYHPDLSLFVQVSPVFCCPALVTEAMSSRIEQITGVPVVAVTYDGIGGSKNDVIIPYLKSPRMRPAART